LSGFDRAHIFIELQSRFGFMPLTAEDLRRAARASKKVSQARRCLAGKVTGTGNIAPGLL